MDTVYETPKQSIARQLREVRKAEGMTQQHLAELVGTKKSNISRFESGKYNPSVEFLMKLADGLGKEIQIVVGDKSMTKKLAGYKDNDVELCRTTNTRVSDKTAMILMEERIPFSKNLKTVPFFKRKMYKGADKVWVISINPRRYGQARRIIDTLDSVYKERLVLSNY